MPPSSRSSGLQIHTVDQGRKVPRFNTLKTSAADLPGKFLFSSSFLDETPIVQHNRVWNFVTFKVPLDDLDAKLHPNSTRLVKTTITCMTLWKG
jgi:hypothetical protein